jgi:hypothetical protein
MRIGRPPTHGKTKTREFLIWVHMRQRCRDAKHEHYPRYGGRGITVCDRWNDSFESFLEDMGTAPSRLHTIDRKDNDGNYEAGNCRWATRKEQAQNRKRAIWVTHRGRRMALIDMAKEVGVPYPTLWYRHNRGLPLLPAAA